MTTLHTAIFSGWAAGTDLSDVERLLDDGHDVDGLDESGDTPLISAALVAAAADRSEVATRLLLARGADPNRRGEESERAPLHIAVCGVAEGTVRALLEGGADPDLPCGAGASPIHHALSELRRAANGSSFDNPNGNASVCAEFVSTHLRSLAAHGADFDRPTPGGVAPVALAATIKGCPDAVLDALLDGGATVRGVTIPVGETDVDLLSNCIFSELSPEIAKRLVDAGCPCDVPYAPFGDRPFVEVVPQYRPEMALALCRHSDRFKAALLAYRTNGLSMLAAAAAAGSEPLVTYLVQEGLSPHEAGDDGRTPVDVAKKHQPELVELLERLAAN